MKILTLLIHSFRSSLTLLLTVGLSLHLIGCSEQHKAIQSTELRKTSSVQLENVSNSNLDSTQHTFKVLRNDPADYGDESYQIKTDQGNLSIYSLNINKQQAQLLASVKSGECLTLSSQSDDFAVVEGDVSVMELANISIHPCK